MNTQSGRRRALRLAGLAGIVTLAAVLAGTAVVSAQSRSDRGPWEKLDLTTEQRGQVRDIVKEHRETSRQELHKKLATVLTDEQLAQLEAMGTRRDGSDMWRDRPGRPGHRGRREMLTPGRRHHRGGGCDCDRSGHQRGGGAMRRGGGGKGGHHGSGPHMGEFREERGQRMVERLSVVLDLTDAQTEEIAKVVKEHQAQFKDFDRSQLTFEERQKTRDAHRMLLANRVKEVLTDAQKDKYDEFMETMPGPRRGDRGKRR